MHAAAHKCTTVKEKPRFRRCQNVLRKEALCGSFPSLPNALKNIALIQERRRDRFLPRQCEEALTQTPTLAVKGGNAVDASKNWQNCFVFALQSKRGSVLVKVDAKLFAFFACIIVFTTPATCWDEAVSASTTHFRNFFMMSEEIAIFPSNCSFWKIFTNSASRLQVTILRAPREK